MMKALNNYPQSSYNLLTVSTTKTIHKTCPNNKIDFDKDEPQAAAFGFFFFFF